MNRNKLASLLIATVLLLGSCALSCSTSLAWRAPPGPVWTRQDRQGDERRLHEGSVDTMEARRRRLGDRPPSSPPPPEHNGPHATDVPLGPPGHHLPPPA